MKKSLLAVALLAVSTSVFAEDGSGWAFNGFASAAVYVVAVAFAAYGGTAAQSKAASVALEGIARNPSAADKIMTPMILGLALMESLVIFTLITIFLV